MLVTNDVAVIPCEDGQESREMKTQDGPDGDCIFMGRIVTMKGVMIYLLDKYLETYDTFS